MKFKLLNDQAIMPTRAYNSAGIDLYSPIDKLCFGVGIFLVHLGIASEFPPGHVVLLADRSSMARRGFHIVGGVIDSDYRGEWIVQIGRFRPQSSTLTDLDSMAIHRGDKIAQALVLPVRDAWELYQVEDLSKTDRGDRGFGSSGR